MSTHVNAHHTCELSYVGMWTQVHILKVGNLKVHMDLLYLYTSLGSVIYSHKDICSWPYLF